MSEINLKNKCTALYAPSWDSQWEVLVLSGPSVLACKHILQTVSQSVVTVYMTMDSKQQEGGWKALGTSRGSKMYLG